MAAALMALTATGCNHDTDPIIGDDSGKIVGFYVLNSGTEIKNVCSLDYYDYEERFYIRDFFKYANSAEESDIGELGNDLAVYSDKLWAVIFGSGVVKVMDAGTARLLKTIEIPGCRNIVFGGDYAYVSSYADATRDACDRLGYVAKIDLQSLEIVDVCNVGYQPEEMAIAKGKLYVANSGCYRERDYEHSVSVIDLATFDVIDRIDVAINLHHVRLDSYGKLWVSSRGDYYDEHPRLFCIDTDSDMVIDIIPDLPCSNFDICGDSLYVCNNIMNNFSFSFEPIYAILDVTTHEIVSDMFIKDGSETELNSTNSIAVNPDTREILITDVKDDVPGTVLCYSPEGVLQWSVYAGISPSRIVFIRQ